MNGFTDPYGIVEMGMQPPQGQSGLLGSFVRSHLLGRMTGAPNGGGGGLPPEQAAERGVIAGKGGLATTFAPASMVEGTPGQDIMQGFNIEGFSKFLTAQGLGGNLFARFIDRILESRGGKKTTDLGDFFK